MRGHMTPSVFIDGRASGLGPGADVAHLWGLNSWPEPRMSPRNVKDLNGRIGLKNLGFSRKGKGRLNLCTLQGSSGYGEDIRRWSMIGS